MAHDKTHASSHMLGGGDAIKLDELDTPSAGTALDAATGLHGLMPAPGGNPLYVYCGDAVQRPLPGFSDYAQLEDQEAANTAGAALAAGDWRTRTLNTKIYDPNGFCTLGANRFTLPAGLYYVSAQATANSVGVNRLRIWSTTRGQLLLGMDADAFVGTVVGVTINTSCSALLQGQLLAATTETFELQHRAASSGTFGLPTGWDTEVYAVLQIIRLRDDTV